MEYIILNDSNNDIKKYILPKKKVSMHIAFKLFIGWCFIFNFDITMTYFLSSHFSFYVCDKCNVIGSKVHYESIKK